MNNIEKIRQEIERLKKLSESSKKEWIDEGYNQNAFAEDCRIKSFDKLLAFIDSLPEESQMPMSEDTVIFQKGIAEGRRLEREDNNKALAEMYGYEGGTESPLVKITFTIPKEQVKNLMPIKQGDVFGIENLTNKEGRR